MSRWHDWDGTVRCDTQAILRPANEQSIVDIEQSAIRSKTVVRTFGAGHSWSELVSTDGVLINLDALTYAPEIDKLAYTATLPAGMRIRDAGPLLQSHGMTFQNVGAITPQSLAGAMGSGTHGTGRGFGIIGTQLIGVRIVDGRGQLKDYDAINHPREMAALRLSLGALGVIVRVTLQCVADYSVRLEMLEMTLAQFLNQFEALYQANERVRAYWFPGSDRVFVHTMNPSDEKKTEPGSIYSWTEAVLERRVLMGAFWWLGRSIPGLVPACNRIQETVGYKKDKKWGRCFDAITTPIPPFHQEAEVAVPIEVGAQAVSEYGDLVKKLGCPVNVPSEIRFSKADDVLLSPNYGRDVCYIGGYNAMYRSGDRFFTDYCQDLQDRYGARPHWGKIGAPDRATAQKLFPGLAEFERIRGEFDPDAVFANGYLRELFAL